MRAIVLVTNYLETIMDLQNLVDTLENGSVSLSESLLYRALVEKGAPDFDSLTPDEKSEIGVEIEIAAAIEKILLVHNKEFSLKKLILDKAVDDANEKIIDDIRATHNIIEFLRKLEVEDVELEERLLDDKHIFEANIKAINEKYNDILLQEIKNNIIKFALEHLVVELNRKISLYDDIEASLNKTLSSLNKAIDTIESIAKDINEIVNIASDFSMVVAENIEEIIQSSENIFELIPDDDAASITSLDEINDASSEIFESLNEMNSLASEMRELSSEMRSSTPSLRAMESMRDDIIERKRDIVEKKSELEDIKDQLSEEVGEELASISIKEESKIEKFIKQLRYRLDDKSLDEMTDESILDELDEDIEEIESIDSAIVAISRKMSEAKGKYLSAAEQYKGFCDRVAESARAEGRSSLNEDEKRQLQEHAGNFREAKSAVKSLNADMVNCIGKMRAISEKYKDDIQDLDMSAVLEPWKQTSSDPSENLMRNNSISFSGGHRAPSQPFSFSEKPDAPEVDPVNPMVTPTKPKSNSGKN